MRPCLSCASCPLLALSSPVTPLALAQAHGRTPLRHKPRPALSCDLATCQTRSDQIGIGENGRAGQELSWDVPVPALVESVRATN